MKLAELQTKTSWNWTNGMSKTHSQFIKSDIRRIANRFDYINMTIHANKQKKSDFKGILTPEVKRNIDQALVAFYKLPKGFHNCTNTAKAIDVDCLLRITAFFEIDEVQKWLTSNTCAEKILVNAKTGLSLPRILLFNCSINKCESMMEHLMGRGAFVFSSSVRSLVTVLDTMVNAPPMVAAFLKNLVSSRANRIPNSELLSSTCKQSQLGLGIRANHKLTHIYSTFDNQSLLNSAAAHKSHTNFRAKTGLDTFNDLSVNNKLHKTSNANYDQVSIIFAQSRSSYTEPTPIFRII